MANFWNVPPWIIHSDAIKPITIRSIILGNQTGRPENADMLKNWDYIGIFVPTKKTQKLEKGQFLKWGP